MYSNIDIKSTVLFNSWHITAQHRCDEELQTNYCEIHFDILILRCLWEFIMNADEKL